MPWLEGAKASSGSLDRAQLDEVGARGVSLVSLCVCVKRKSEKNRHYDLYVHKTTSRRSSCQRSLAATEGR